jgi:hypothetical protein
MRCGATAITWKTIAVSIGVAEKEFGNAALQPIETRGFRGQGSLVCIPAAPSCDASECEQQAVRGKGSHRCDGSNRRAVRQLVSAISAE